MGFVDDPKCLKYHKDKGLLRINPLLEVCKKFMSKRLEIEELELIMTRLV